MEATLRTLILGRESGLKNNSGHGTSYPTGGSWRQAQGYYALTGEVEEVTLEETAYSDSGWAVRHADDDDDQDAAERGPVLVIK